MRPEWGGRPGKRRVLARLAELVAAAFERPRSSRTAHAGSPSRDHTHPPSQRRLKREHLLGERRLGADAATGTAVKFYELRDNLQLRRGLDGIFEGSAENPR